MLRQSEWLRIKKGMDIQINAVYLLHAYEYPPFLGTYSPVADAWVPVVLDPTSKRYVIAHMKDTPQPAFFQELTVPYYDLEEQVDGSYSVKDPPSNSLES